ncbi:MAG: UDP-N-acetylmuramoyl-L-alanyl-D-glutamate--2,6-diaminopimelate ligase [Dehalococcoidia bacterium]|nr:UDP-N-acetylmuramoyl-L-alanyl-D-glutamate--2,6-diaminopimelate ligase [Dehalococcoidia bacterium]
MAKSLAELASALGLPSEPDWSSIDVTGICEDTRRLLSGDLFVAIAGHDRDGGKYVDRAIENGAVAVLAEHALSASVPVLLIPDARAALAQLSAAIYDHPTRDLFTVGVTGTNGKTTVCHWVADILGQSQTRVVSTVQNLALGMPGLTTPPSPIIQAMARRALEADAQHLILEASSAGIEQGRVSAIDFDVGVFTNFSLEHVRHHSGLAAYRKAKLKLFETLKSEAWAIVNADDSMAEVLAAATPAQVLRYGFDCRADVSASAIRLGPRSSQFTVRVPEAQELDVSLPSPGLHNISNALAAISVGVVAGISLPVITERLTQARPIPGRSEFFNRSDGLVAVIDFAHNGASLEALLATLRPSYRRLIVVFGCPGDGESEKRASMGEASARWADIVVLTSDNPKHEDARTIAGEIRAGMTGGQISVSIIIDRTAAIGVAIDQAEPGDLVVLAGKGHETEQLIRGERVPHSDADVLQDLGFIADTGVTNTDA